MKFVRKIDRYVFVEFISPFLGGIIFFTFIFLMFQALRLAELLVVRGVTLTVVGKMVVYNVLQFLPFTIPVSFLMGVLITFGRLSSDSELVAMKATGISLHRLSVPVFASAIVVAVLSLSLNLNWVPEGNQKLKSLLVKASNTKIASALQEGIFTSGFYDLLIYAGKLDDRTGRMKNVFIYDERKPNFPFVMIAEEGEILKIESDQELGSEVALHLYDGSVHRINHLLEPGGNSTNETIDEDASEETRDQQQRQQQTKKDRQEYQRFDFKEEISYLQIIEGHDNSSRKPKAMTYQQLKEALKEEGHSPGMKTRFLTEIHNRYAQALSTLFFTLLGIGFGTSRGRSSRSSAVLVTLISIVAFYSLRVLGTQLSHQGSLHPALATELSNLVFLAVGLYAYRKASW